MRLLITNFHSKTTESILFSARFLITTMSSKLLECTCNRTDVVGWIPTTDLFLGTNEDTLFSDFLSRTWMGFITTAISYTVLWWYWNWSDAIRLILATNLNCWTTEGCLLLAISFDATITSMFFWYWNRSQVRMWLWTTSFKSRITKNILLSACSLMITMSSTLRWWRWDWSAVNCWILTTNHNSGTINGIIFWDSLSITTMSSTCAAWWKWSHVLRWLQATKSNDETTESIL